MRLSKHTAYRWCVTTLSGHRLPLGSVRTWHLTNTLLSINELLGSSVFQYDKVYRNLRAAGGYAQVVELPAMFGEKPQMVVVTIALAIER